MPYRKTYRKRKATSRPRRRTYRRKYHKKASTSVVRGPTAVPDRMMVKLRYSDNFTATTTTSMNLQLMTVNNPYDPDKTGVGHQPLGWDQWTAFYDRYKCFGSKITLTVLNESTTEQGFVGLVCKNENTAVANLPTLMEKPYAKIRFIPTEGSGGKNPAYVSSYMSTKKIFGVKFLDDDYAALTSTSPANVAYWHIYVQAADEVTSCSFRFFVSIKYYVMFYDRKGLTQS